MLDRLAKQESEDPPHPAEAASLLHVGDDDPGIRRRRSGRGFFYVGPDGDRVTDARTVERIRALAIPPAWTDVWICRSPRGHIQATGRDDKGRKQYRYHEKWAAFRDETKYASLAAFARALPSLRKRVDADLRRRGMPREKVIASVVWLLDNAMIRVGNDSYAKQNGSFGLTTLRTKHVAIAGSTLRFSFRGKSGKEWNLKLVDRRLARILKNVAELPGQNLFQYLDEDGERRAVRSQDVNDYIRDAMGPEFSSKHFRTWGGTVAAAGALAATPVPETKTAMRRTLNLAIDEVAGVLGNTRAVCRSCYIHPRVIDAWSQGTLERGLGMARDKVKRTPKGLDRAEAIVARWLVERPKAERATRPVRSAWQAASPASRPRVRSAGPASRR
ncbi:MAG: DNA topoisomerase IB [Rhizobiaceae bacterium]